MHKLIYTQYSNIKKNKETGYCLLEIQLKPLDPLSYKAYSCNFTKFMNKQYKNKKNNFFLNHPKIKFICYFCGVKYIASWKNYS